MRLIDADELILHLNDYALQEAPFRGESADTYNAIENCIKAVEEQPTAYDIDKVVEELESFAKLAEDRWTNGTSKHAYQEHKCWVKAIEIVKHGIVSDDVCEYRITDKVVYASCNNKQIASAFCWINECGDYKYCPYCGKKIKVIDNDK